MFNELIKDIHQNAIAHGWWETDRSFGGVLALIHSELSEALEEYRNGREKIYFDACKHPTCKSCFGQDSNGNPESILDSCHCEYAKPEGIAVELVDVVIRIFDYFGAVDVDVSEAILNEEVENLVEGNAFEDFITECHALVSFAWIAFDTGDESSDEYLMDLIKQIMYWFEAEDIDLESMINLKHDYNKTRPYRHGGKVI